MPFRNHKPRMKTLQIKLWWVLAPLMFTLQIYAQSDRTDKSPHKTGFITANNVKLHYLDWGGAGETLLFLHGMGDTAHIYDELAPKFTNQFRVLGLTRRGHGESEIPETGCDTATLAEDIRQFLDALKIQRVVLYTATEFFARLWAPREGTRPTTGRCRPGPLTRRTGKRIHFCRCV